MSRYLNGNKATWRGWVWNRISERIRDSKKAKALYLIGDSDEDRKKAISKGFRNENLIGIDMRQSSVDAVRRDGGIAICADINEVIREWPKDKDVHVVVLDFCGGLQENTAQSIPFLLTNRAFVPSVVVINLQRGRDNVAGALPSLVKYSDYSDATRFLREKHEKNRARILVEALASGLAYSQCEVTGGRIEDAFPSVMNSLAPVFYSCSPNTVVMDTVVFTLPDWWRFELRTADSFLETKRKISAMLAVQTMKSR